MEEECFSHALRCLQYKHTVCTVRILVIIQSHCNALMQPFFEIYKSVRIIADVKNIRQNCNTIYAVPFGFREHIIHRIEAIFIFDQHKCIINYLPCYMDAAF